jgi:hypothetical protein
MLPKIHKAGNFPAHPDNMAVDISQLRSLQLNDHSSIQLNIL